MKKLLVLFCVILCMITVVGCSSSSSSKDEPKEPITENEFTAMFEDPEAFKDRPITIKGQVRGVDGSKITMYHDPEHLTGLMFIDTSGLENNEITINGFYTISGTVKGKRTVKIGGENKDAVNIDISSYEISTYQEVVRPAKKTIECNQTQSRLNLSVTLSKIEFADEETRVYLHLQNTDSQYDATLIVNECTIVQDQKQISEVTNKSAGYPELPQTIVKGASVDAIICFPKINQQSFTFNYRPYVFEDTMSFEIVL